MPTKKHQIKLTSAEREQLRAIANSRRAAVFKVQRAKALLATDMSTGSPSLTDSEAALASGLSVPSIERLRARSCEVGPLAALERKRREVPPVPPKVTGEIEARMVQIACSEAPEGRESWSMDLIAERIVELRLLPSLSGETVRRYLKKTRSNPGTPSGGAPRRRETPPS